jgi:hypothetical protein
VAKARASIWLPASHGSDGTSAPVTASSAPAVEAHTSTVLRPRLSAWIMISSATSPPTRTALPATPRAELLAPNSSPAKGMVWVNSVPRYPEAMVSRARVPRTDAPRASRRAGGAHQGGRSVPFRCRARLKRGTNRKPKYGTARRKSTVWVTRTGWPGTVPRTTSTVRS